MQHIPEPIFHPKRNPLPRRSRPAEVENMRDEEQDYQEEEEEEDEEKTSHTSPNNFRSRCSRGVSTDEIEATQKNSNRTELTLEEGSPPSTSSTVSDKANESNSNSKRFEDGDPDDTVFAEPVLTRNSVLLQLIACGSMVSGKTKNGTNLKRSSVNGNILVKNTNLHKGVLCKTAAKVAEEDMINYISENPRFGNLQSEEKEYFSGSIVESMTEDRVSIPPVLKKSSSYNEERSVIQFHNLHLVIIYRASYMIIIVYSIQNILICLSLIQHKFLPKTELSPKICRVSFKSTSLIFFLKNDFVIIRYGA